MFKSKKVHLVAWWCVLGHCTVEKQMMVSLSSNQMGWHVNAEYCGSHVDSVC